MDRRQNAVVLVGVMAFAAGVGRFVRKNWQRLVVATWMLLVLGLAWETASRVRTISSYVSSIERARRAAGW